VPQRSQAKFCRERRRSEHAEQNRFAAAAAPAAWISTPHPLHWRTYSFIADSARVLLAQSRPQNFRSLYALNAAPHLEHVNPRMLLL
jgi:hypothetical protein